jgi:hypothetical protein
MTGTIYQDYVALANLARFSCGVPEFPDRIKKFRDQKNNMEPGTLSPPDEFK